MKFISLILIFFSLAIPKIVFGENINQNNSSSLDLIEMQEQSEKFTRSINVMNSLAEEKAAKKFFKKILSNPHVTIPTVINVDRNPAFPPAHSELVKENELPASSKLRRIKYLNNIVENDHKSVKRKSRYRQWYQSFDTAAAASFIQATN